MDKLLRTSKARQKLNDARMKEDPLTVDEVALLGADRNFLKSLLNTNPIYGAILSGNQKMIRELIRLGTDVNSTCPPTKITPLSFGISTGNAKIVRLLLDSGANIHTKYSTSNSALHITARHGMVKIAELLIDRGLDVNILNEFKATPLHYAVSCGRTQMVRYLIARGADISAICIYLEPYGETDLLTNITPLMIAAEMANADIADILIKAGADVNIKTSMNDSALFWAAKSGSVKMVSMFLKAGAGRSVNERSNSKGFTALYIAAHQGHLEVVKALLKVEGIDVNALSTPTMVPREAVTSANIAKENLVYGPPVSGATVNMLTPLHAALMRTKDEVARVLIEHGADAHATDLNDASPLHFACQNGVSLDIIRILLEKGANVNAQDLTGATPLQFAALQDHVEIVKFLVDHGADCNVRDTENLTALNYAAMNNCVKTVTYFVTEVAGSHMKSDFLTRSIHCAALNGHLEVIEILLKNGGSVDVQNSSKHTPLHFAAHEGHVGAAELLLNRKAALELKDLKEGCTPLFLAVKNQQEKLVNLLLDRGADVNAANTFGVLPIHAAVKTVNVNIVKALLAKGAHFNAAAEPKDHIDVKYLECLDYAGVPLEFAQKAGNTELITILELVRNLFLAVLENDLYKVRYFLKAGAIVNATDENGLTVLHYAVIEKNIEAIKILLANGAMSEDNLYVALFFAIENGFIDIAEILLAHGKNLSFTEFNIIVNARSATDGTTLLHTAVENGHLQIVKLLLANGAVYNAKNNAGKTPLEVVSADEMIKTLLSSADRLLEAIVKGYSLNTVMQILKDNECIVNAQAIEREVCFTFLCWAFLVDRGDIADVLVSKGADCCSATRGGTTALHIAAFKGNVKLVKKILSRIESNGKEKVADFVNVATTSGVCALHEASNLKIVKCLLQAGAVYDIRNNKGETLVELTEDDDIRAFLKMTHQLFKDIKKGGTTVMNKLNGLDAEEFRAVTGTRNTEGKTLIRVALDNAQVKIGSKLVERLKNLS